MALNTKDNNKYNIYFIHASFGKMNVKLEDGEELYDNHEEIETDMCKIIEQAGKGNITHIVCLNDNGDSLIVPKNVIEDSVLCIEEVKIIIIQT